MAYINNKGIEVQKKILNKFGNVFEPINIVAKSKDPDEVVKNLQSKMPVINDGLDKGYFVRVESIFNYLSFLETNKGLLDKLREISNKQRALDYVINKLKQDDSKKEEYEFLESEKQRILDLLKMDISKDSFGFEEFKKVLPQFIFNKFFAEDKKTGDYYAITYIYPKKRIEKDEDINAIKNYLDIDNGIMLTGLSLMVGRLETVLKKEFKFITLFVAIALLVVLTIIYKRFFHVCICLFPVMMGIASVLLVMMIFKIKFNYINIVAFPLIIGMGIDDAIYMMQHYFENSDRNLFAVLKQTGKAMILTSLTTMMGFGSLIYTQHKGLMSLGIIVFIGMGACLVYSLFVLPGLLSICAKKNEK